MEDQSTRREEPDAAEAGKAPISARRAFLRADFFAYMLDYQATAARMAQDIAAAALAAGKALEGARETRPIEDYLQRLKEDGRRLRQARALPDEELDAIQANLGNMPGAVRRHLTEAQTGAPASADPGPVTPHTGPRFPP